MSLLGIGASGTPLVNVDKCDGILSDVVAILVPSENGGIGCTIMSLVSSSESTLGLSQALEIFK